MITSSELEIILKIARQNDVTKLIIDGCSVEFRDPLVARDEMKLPEQMPSHEDFMFMASGLEPVSLKEVEEEKPK